MAMSRNLAGTALTTLPSIDTVPDVIGSSPAIMRNTVDLPQPDGPSSTMNSRAATVTPTSCTAGGEARVVTRGRPSARVTLAEPFNRYDGHLRIPLSNRAAAAT